MISLAFATVGGLWGDGFEGVVIVGANRDGGIKLRETGSGEVVSRNGGLRNSPPFEGGVSVHGVRVVQTGLRARIGKRAGFRKDKRDLVLSA